MKTKNTKAQMRKGVIEYCILLLIKHKDQYVSDIIENLENSKMIAVEGTLYPMLIRLKNEGYLGYRWEESLQGPPRKYYELTQTGQLFLNDLENSWIEMLDAVFHINGSK